MAKIRVYYTMRNKQAEAENCIDLNISDEIMEHSDDFDKKHIRFDYYENMVITDTIRKIARLQGYMLIEIESIELI